jgi:hypothetical protein
MPLRYLCWQPLPDDISHQGTHAPQTEPELKACIQECTDLPSQDFGDGNTRAEHSSLLKFVFCNAHEVIFPIYLLFSSIFWKKPLAISSVAECVERN